MEENGRKERQGNGKGENGRNKKEGRAEGIKARHKWKKMEGIWKRRGPTLHSQMMPIVSCPAFFHIHASIGYVFDKFDIYLIYI